MQSPFPGMDPYIEACNLWGDFQHSLLHEIASYLARNTPDRYLVRTGQRSYLALHDSEDKVIYPCPAHVRAAVQGGQKKRGTAMTEAAGEQPHILRAYLEEEHREIFLNVYEAGPEQRLVTTVEVLSPSNKRPGTHGWDLYQRKRLSLMVDGVNLVEIDLLRGGQRMPMLDPWPDSPYRLMVARARKPHACLVWKGYFQRPLPTIRIPLAKPDPDISLSMQPLIESIYQRYRYAQTIDYSLPLTPPLKDEEAA
jgi:hypothetical protein